MVDASTIAIITTAAVSTVLSFHAAYRRHKRRAVVESKPVEEEPEPEPEPEPSKPVDVVIVKEQQPQPKVVCVKTERPF